MASPSAADLQVKYDVIIDGQGYIFAPSDVGLPPSVFGVKNKYGFTPTFIQRSNTSGDYGDNQQDFWLSATQRDWSLGEQQRYFHSSDPDSVRRYWTGDGADARKAGQVSLYGAPSAVTLGAAPVAIATRPMGLTGPKAKILAAGSTNLYSVDNTFTVTDQGLHGLGAAPSRWGICTDGAKAYLSTNKTDSVGSVGVRQWSGIAFGNFATAVGVDSLAYLNNSLYGLDWSLGVLYRFDSSGNATNLFQWLDATGNAIRLGSSTSTSRSKIFPYGGKLGILLVPNSNSASTEASLWVYDGTGVSMVAELPGGFYPYDAIEAQGNIYVSGHLVRTGTTYPAIYYYASGNIGKLWESDTAGSPGPALAPWQDGLLFSDYTDTALKYYNGFTGGIQTLSKSWLTQAPQFLGVSPDIIVAGTSLNTTAQGFREATFPTSATITTSLFDFDSSLVKLFRGITVEFDAGTDGNGGSVDIAYRTEDLNSTFTTLQTSAASGTEYKLTGISGKRISIKVTLNRGTSTYGPVLKRVKIRAVPIQTSFANCQYVLYLAGASKWSPGDDNPTPLRDGTVNPLGGDQQAANLVTAAEKTTPITIIDSINGTFTGVIDQSNFEITQIKPGEYVAVVGVRQV